MATEHLTIELDPQLRAALEEKARESGLEPGALARRYVAEGLEMGRYPVIVFRDSADGRRPYLAGRQLTIRDIVTTYAGSSSAEEAADYLHISMYGMQIVLAYYADHREEVDAWVKQFEDDAERAHEAWLQQQSLHAT